MEIRSLPGFPRGDCSPAGLFREIEDFAQILAAPEIFQDKQPLARMAQSLDLCDWSFHVVPGRVRHHSLELETKPWRQSPVVTSSIKKT